MLKTFDSVLCRLVSTLALWAAWAAAGAATPMVSGGWGHSVALHADGAVFATGDDGWGQLGQSRLLFSSVPMSVNVGPVRQFTSGDGHAVALLQDGTVRSWGWNSFGQLGDGTVSNRSSPVAVPNLSTVTAVAAGLYHTLALKADGSVWAWGANSGPVSGESRPDSRVPVRVSNLDNVLALAAGGGWSLALKNDGTLWAWGSNSYGQVGTGDTAYRLLPALVANNIKAITAGSNHTLALKQDGTVWTWGSNSHGQLGDGSTTNRASPVQVSNLSNVSAIAAGENHSHALMQDGTVRTWGNGFVLGDGTWNNRLAPVTIDSLTDVTAIASSTWNTMVLRKDGTVWGWGANYDGQLGFLSTDSYVLNAPVQVPGVYGATAITLGTSFSLAQTQGGTLWAWGRNNYGQLADGGTPTRSTPAKVTGIADVSGIAAGFSHTLALKLDGTVWAWGNNVMGQLGDGTSINQSSPVKVSGLANVAAVAAGEGFSLALKQDHSVWAWGNNYYGELGDGTTIYRNTPVQVAANVAAIAAGLYHTVALKQDGSVWVWGWNGDGQLGDGSTTNRSSPVQVSSDGIVIAAGHRHTVLIRSDGSLWAWGDNRAGELGDGTLVSRTTPVAVLGLGGAKSVCAGDSYTIATLQDGAVWGWGSNYLGQLGDGTATIRPAPVQLPGLKNSVSIACGALHAAATQANGRPLAWGHNIFGQLGNGTLARSLAPALMVNADASGYFQLAAGKDPIALAQQVPFFTVASGAIADTSASVSTSTKFNPSDTGKAGSVFVTAMVPSGSLGTTAIGVSPTKDIFTSQPPQFTATSACPAAANPLTLVQLTPSGWQTVVNGQLIPYASGVLGDQLAAQTILNGADTTNLKGAEFCVGYGTSAQDMVNNGNIRAVATIPGATTSSSCVVGGTITVGLSVAAGWNLLGNPVNQSLGVAQKFGDASKVNTVWKWDATKANWQFYTPSLNATDLLAYATAQGYGVLSDINAGDGYWVHAKTQADLGSLCGQAINIRQSSLSSGWNLVSTASPISAKEFNLTLSTSAPTAGQIPVNLTSLWAWDNTASQWYFYAPVLDAQGASTLLDYIGAKSYKDFTSAGKTLGNGVGIWVNRP